MPRYARCLSETQVYHVMLRGNNRENLFIDDEDKTRIIDILRDKKKAGEFYLYAFCVMTNHIHLVIKEGKDPLARIVKRIGTSYAYYFNKKYKRIGHVFQDRYRSENIENDSYLLSVIRYVHQNPLKPGIGTIEGYKWSSYKEFFKKEISFIEIDEILSIFSNDRQKAMGAFARFNHEKTDEIFIDIGEDKEIDQTNVRNYIQEYLANHKLDKDSLRDVLNKQYREEVIKLLLEKSSLSQRGIALELGLSKDMVRRVSAITK